MRIEIPERAELSNMEALADCVVDDGEADVSVVLSDAQFSLHPLALCMLAAAVDRPAETGAAVIVSNLNDGARSLHRMGLFEGINRPDLAVQTDVESAGSYIPLARISDNKQLKTFVTDFIPLIHASPEQADTLKYVLYELVRNVLEHSGSRYGAYAAAEMTDSGRLLIGVADSGIGVKRSIRRAHPAESEADAIKLAFSPGVTGTTKNYGGNETNGGAGLFFMKAMASLARERMVMITGDTLMRLEVQEGSKPQIFAALDQDNVSWRQLESPFPGTAVGVDLVVEDTVAFSALLSEIRQVYQLRLRSTKEGQRRARFT